MYVYVARDAETGFLLTKDYGYLTPAPRDEAAIWAAGHEHYLRELRYRSEFYTEALHEIRLAEVVPARDAGDVCGICGEAVTWVDHLPPRDPGGIVRCFANVRSLKRDVVIDDVFPAV